LSNDVAQMSERLSRSIGVLHITDPHLFAAADGDLRGTVTDSTLTDVLHHYRESDWSADLCVMTGDVIQDGTSAAYERFCNHLAPLNMPVYCVPGNHDDRTLMHQALAEPPFYYCDTVEIGDWLVVGIDSCLDGEAGGHVAGDEMRRLGELLIKTSAKHALVCLHHPPLPMGSKWLDQVGLQNGGEFLELVSRSEKVRIALFGHVHQEFFVEHENVKIVGTPSTCRQFKPRSDEFALDESPPAYRRINLLADGSVDTKLIWLPSNE